MQRWKTAKSVYVENEKIDAFLKEVLAVCKKHGFMISHEDGQGGFEVVDFERGDADWLRNATDCTEET